MLIAGFHFREHFSVGHVAVDRRHAYPLPFKGRQPSQLLMQAPRPKAHAVPLATDLVRDPGEPRDLRRLRRSAAANHDEEQDQKPSRQESISVQPHLVRPLARDYPRYTEWGARARCEVGCKA